MEKDVILDTILDSLQMSLLVDKLGYKDGVVPEYMKADVIETINRLYVSNCMSFMSEGAELGFILLNNPNYLEILQGEISKSNISISETLFSSTTAKQLQSTRMVLYSLDGKRFVPTALELRGIIANQIFEKTK